MGKFAEAQKILRQYKIRLKHLNYSYPEIRADDVKQVAFESAKSLFKKIKKPLIVDDTGLFIDSLNGFPGVYSAWAYKKIGNRGILKLLEAQTSRNAFFKCCVGYADSKICKVFCGKVHGTIAEKERGTFGFGYDPIFVPNKIEPRLLYKPSPCKEDKIQTFAENETLKNHISHRFNAFTEFAKWYTNYIIQK